MNTEQDRAQMEAERNAAEEEYFYRPLQSFMTRHAAFEAGYERGWNARNKKVLELQARIDALMLEHCPKEMTAEQRWTWEQYQTSLPKEPT